MFGRDGGLSSFSCAVSPKTEMPAATRQAVSHRMGGRTGAVYTRAYRVRAAYHGPHHARLPGAPDP